MIISCSRMIKKAFLERRVKRSNYKNDDKKDAVLFRGHTRKTAATATPIMDTKCGDRSKDCPQKLTTSNVHQAILV